MINIYQDSQVFTNVVFESTKKLIKNKIWPINPLEYKAWMKNFVTKEEQFFCACLLDSLLFRTDEQVIASYHSIFNQHIPALQIKYKSDIGVKRNIRPLLQKDQKLVKLVTVNSADSAGKSSHVLANLLRKKLGVLQCNIIPPSDLEYCYNEGTSLFIFIDDFLGSGDQFQKQLEYYLNPKWDRGMIIYCPLIAHEQGIEDVVETYPNVIIQPVELIAKDYCFFTKYFSDEGNTADLSKEFYKKFMNEKGFFEDLYGYKQLGVSVAFEHSCPDNTLLAFRGDNKPKYSKLF